MWLLGRLAGALGARAIGKNRFKFTSVHEMLLFITCVEEMRFFPCDNWGIMTVFVEEGIGG